MIDFEWFRKYVNPANLRCILSPSSEPCNYAASENDKIVYSVVWSDGSALVHEYCHWFGNPIGAKWYDENSEFKKWCEDTINIEKLPFYGEGKGIAHEYCARAFDILYKVQHGENLELALLKEKNNHFENAFPHMKEVYKMVLELDKTNTHK